MYAAIRMELEDFQKMVSKLREYVVDNARRGGYEVESVDVVISQNEDGRSWQLSFEDDCVIDVRKGDFIHYGNEEVNALLEAKQTGEVKVTFGVEDEPTVYENNPHLSLEECVRDCIEQIVFHGDGSKPNLVNNAVDWLYTNTFLPDSPSGDAKASLGGVVLEFPEFDMDGTRFAPKPTAEDLRLAAEWDAAGRPGEFDHMMDDRCMEDTYYNLPCTD